MNPWKFFDEEEFKRDLAKLAIGDRNKIVALMELYLAIGNRRPVFIETYGEGLLCLRHSSGAYKGRCLFFLLEEDQPIELLIYRKDSDKADPRMVDTALNRMRKYRNK
jgi:Phage derived protein Gp49-like (DUF891)